MVLTLTSTAAGLLAGAVVLCGITGGIRTAPSVSQAGPWRRELGSGLSLLWRNQLLRTMALTLTVICSCWGAWFGLLPLVVTQELRLTAHGYGLVVSALGAGGICGAATARRLNRLIGQRWTMFAVLVGTFVMLAGPALLANPWTTGVCAFLGGTGGTLWTVNARTVAQRIVPTSAMGRYHSAMRMFSWGAVPVGAGVAGLLAGWFGFHVALVLFALCVAMTAVSFLRWLDPRALTVRPVPAAEITRAGRSSEGA